MAAPQRLAFQAQWIDPSSGVQWSYQLFAHVPADAALPLELEMFDIKNRRHFLKRVKCDSVQPSQLYVGSRVVVFARQLHLTAYGDEATRRAVEARAERTLALIKPGATHHTGQLLHAIHSGGFSIINMRMCQLSAAEAAAFCSAPQDAAALSCGPVVALELMAPCGVRRWLDMLGASLGAHGVPADAVHGSDSSAAAAHELAVFFGASPAGASASSRPTSSAAGSLSGAGAGWGGSSGAGGGCAATSLLRSCCRCQGTTLGVILPHAVKEGVAGLMLSEVQAEFDMTGLQQFWLDKLAAAEFLEVYKGAVPPGEFVAMVDELVAGPCIAVEVAARTGGCPVEAFRQLVGPRDPELGRVLRPNTLRARFGASRVRNAMHCTDLEEDGQLETSYFFIVLQQHNQARAVGPAAAVGVC